jgi:hypothetical protein
MVSWAKNVKMSVFLVLFIVHTVSNFPDAPDINVIFSVIEL